MMPRRLVLLAVVSLFSLGCSEGGVPRFDLSGDASFNGAPIPSGKITFQPDRSQGNIGPSATAIIKHGKYETQPGQGAVAGPQDVLIYAYDGSPPSEPLPFGKPLAQPFSTSVEVSADATEHSFDIPKE